jgi:hypothetical protein
MTEPSHDAGTVTELFKLLTNVYERKARLYPALLLFMPVAIVAGCGIATDLSTVKAIVGIIAGFGGLLLLAQIARDPGKRQEPHLFEKWGGMPSVSIFRHRDGCLDKITKARYHRTLATLVPEANAPTPEEEFSDPEASDQIYRAWSSHIRTNTRDIKKYNLLFEENINYGYRRNVFGLRPIGIPITALSSLGALLWLYFRFKVIGLVSPELVGAAIFTLLLLVLWMFYFTSDWVRLAAMAYAERLAECCEHLATMKTSIPKASEESKKRKSTKARSTPN